MLAESSGVLEKYIQGHWVMEGCGGGRSPTVHSEATSEQSRWRTEMGLSLLSVHSSRNLLSTSESQICVIPPWRNLAQWMFLKNRVTSQGISEPQGLAISLSQTMAQMTSIHDRLGLHLSHLCFREHHICGRGVGCSSCFICSFCPLSLKFARINMSTHPRFLPGHNFTDSLVALMKF